MASPELRKLWNLHQIDAALVEIRQRAATLDPGRKLLAELEALEKELVEDSGSAKNLGSELSDLELKQQSAADKIKKLEKDLFGGKIVNPREIEAIQKDIESIRRQRASLDDRIIELLDLLPPAREATAIIEAKIAKVKASLQAHRKAAMEEKTRLETAFKQQNAARPVTAKLVDPLLLSKYEAIRAKQGVGMAVVQKGANCGGCGIMLPERTLEGLKVDKTVTCEQCHRILYFPEGLV